MPFTKDQRVRYTSGHGQDFSARVVRAHRDGSYTVEVRFALKDGKDQVPFYGDKHRVWDNQISSIWPA